MTSSTPTSFPPPLPFPPAGIPDEARRFLKSLGFTSHPNLADSFLSDFAKGLLAAIHFDRQGIVTILPRHSFPLTICGYTDQKVNPDICIITNHLVSMILLLVQRKKPALGPGGPEPPLIAAAIAAFQSNNESRDEMCLPTLDTMIIPCITVEGTQPLFYKVPVTKHLSNCVATGQVPMEQTIVTRCGPPAPSEAHVGMESLDYRRTALRYYYTFRDLAKDCWTPFIAGCKDIF